jgi:hypothetical protein
VGSLSGARPAQRRFSSSQFAGLCIYPCEDDNKNWEECASGNGGARESAKEVLDADVRVFIEGYFDLFLPIKADVPAMVLLAREGG